VSEIYLVTVNFSKVISGEVTSNSDRALFIMMSKAKNSYVNTITFIEKLLGNKCVKQIDNSGIN